MTEVDIYLNSWLISWWACIFSGIEQSEPKHLRMESLLVQLLFQALENNKYLILSMQKNANYLILSLLLYADPSGMWWQPLTLESIL